MLPTIPARPYDGLEVDVIALGNADCIVVTQWHNSTAQRILIDGGSGTDAAVIRDFLLSRNYTNFWAVLCSHLHNDHANGLIQIVEDRAFTFHNAWMHNINNYVGAQSLRRAAAASPDVKQVTELTTELAGAFARRGLTPKEPFTGMLIAGLPFMTVLGPSIPYYRQVVNHLVNAKQPAPNPFPFRPSLAASLLSSGVSLSTIAGIAPLPHRGYAPVPVPSIFGPRPTVPLPPLTGLLDNSSVQENPRTQPFNNTSAILGVTFNGQKLLFTADAGAEALRCVGRDWHHLAYLGVPHHGSDGNLSQRDIERFAPKFAVISAKGDSSHPSRAIVSGLVKVGAQVTCTQHGNLWFYSGNVPGRPDYGPPKLLTGTGSPSPFLPPFSRH